MARRECTRGLSRIVSELILLALTISLAVALSTNIYNLASSYENDERIHPCVNYSWINNTSLLIYVACEASIYVKEIIPNYSFALVYEGNSFNMVSNSSFTIPIRSPTIIVFSKPCRKVILQTDWGLMILTNQYAAST